MLLVQRHACRFAPCFISDTARKGPLQAVLHGLFETQQRSSHSGPSVLLVQPRGRSEEAGQEAQRLAETYAGEPCRAITVGPQAARPNPATFFGKGVVTTLTEHISKASPSKVVVNANLSGVQHRNLEGEWGVPILDRVGLIIEIFAQRARTREARLQVELASLEYKASRLVRAVDSTSGKRGEFGEGAEVVSARERGRSGASSGGLGGSGGGGETELQLQRRRIAQRRKALRLKILEVQRTRQVQRAARQRSGKPVVAVVGYTNAGKSSLIEALTGHDLGVADQLFATLDTTMRSLHLHSGRTAIMSDTVGFISDLPTQLIDAFKGTLEEAVHADLLLHVIDASSPAAAQQRATVLSILRQLGLTDSQLRSRMLEVYNKVDLQDSEAEDAAADRGAPEQPPDESEDEDLNFTQELRSSPSRTSSGQRALDSFRHSSSVAAPAGRPAAVSSSASDKAIAAAQQAAAQAAHQQRQYALASSGGRQQLEGAAVDQQLGGAAFSSVRVSALTGEGLEELLHAVDRKEKRPFLNSTVSSAEQSLKLATCATGQQWQQQLAVRNGLNELAASTAALGQRLLQQNVVGPPRRWKRRRHVTAPPVWQPQWLSPHDSLAGRVFAGLQ